MEEKTGRLDQVVGNALKLPRSQQYALLKVVPHFANGAFWGFDKKKDALEVANDVKEDPSIAVHQLANDEDVLIEVDPKFFMSNLAKTAPELVKAEDLELMRKAMQEALADFTKFIEKSKRQGFAGIIGIYCINDTTTIRYNNVQYPAFRINLETCLAVLEQYGGKVIVNGAPHTPAEVRGLKNRAWQTLVQSPTYTGLFIKIQL